jgi:hypothetical protein
MFGVVSVLVAGCSLAACGETTALGPSRGAVATPVVVASPQSSAELDRAKSVAQAAAHARLGAFERLLAARDVAGVRAHFTDTLSARQSVEETRRVLAELKNGAPAWVQVRRPQDCDQPGQHCRSHYYTAGWETVQDQLLVIDEDASARVTRFEIQRYSCVDAECWAGEVQPQAGSREEIADQDSNVVRQVDAAYKATPPKRSATSADAKLPTFDERELSGDPNVALPAARKRWSTVERLFVNHDIDGVRAYFSDALRATQASDETRWLIAQLRLDEGAVRWVQVCKPTADYSDGVPMNSCRRGYFTDAWRTLLDELLLIDTDGEGRIVRFEIARYACIPHTGCWCGYVRAPPGTPEAAAEHAEIQADGERAKSEGRR